MSNRALFLEYKLIMGDLLQDKGVFLFVFVLFCFVCLFLFVCLFAFVFVFFINNYWYRLL